MHTIKKAIPTDAEAIVHIAAQTWWATYMPILEKEQVDFMFGEIYTIDNISKQIANNEQTYLLLIEDDQPVAFAAYSPRKEDAEIYKLHKLYCIPVTQGKGYGKVLIDAVGSEVLKAGKHILDLNVNRYNKAKNFYEKMGFKIIYEEDVPIGLYFMNDYVMRKEL
jgi:GNAT superfamily N-acetyltransferase